MLLWQMCLQDSILATTPDKKNLVENQKIVTVAMFVVLTLFLFKYVDDNTEFPWYILSYNRSALMLTMAVMKWQVNFFVKIVWS